MALTVEMVTIDCAEPRALAELWTQALEREVASDWEGHREMLAPSSPAAGALVPSSPGSGSAGSAGSALTVLADPEGTVFCAGAPE